MSITSLLSREILQKNTKKKIKRINLVKNFKKANLSLCLASCKIYVSISMDYAKVIDLR